jgi:hypothetical protein
LPLPVAPRHCLSPGPGASASAVGAAIASVKSASNSATSRFGLLIAHLPPQIAASTAITRATIRLPRLLAQPLPERPLPLHPPGPSSTKRSSSSFLSTTTNRSCVSTTVRHQATRGPERPGSGRPVVGRRRTRPTSSGFAPRTPRFRTRRRTRRARLGRPMMIARPAGQSRPAAR